MRATKFFRTIWRFNALAFALLSLFGIIGAGILIYELIGWETRTRHRTDIVNIDPGDNVLEDWGFGPLDEVRGSQYAILPLEFEQVYGLGSYSEKSASSTRNLLFLDLESTAQRWLFPDHAYLIEDYDFLPYGRYDDDVYAVKAVFYSIVKSDTDNDGRLTDEDRLVLALSKPDGTQFTELYNNVSRIIGTHLLDNGGWVVLFEREGETLVATVSLDQLKVISERQISKAVDTN